MHTSCRLIIVMVMAMWIEQIETGKALADHMLKVTGGMNKRVEDLAAGFNSISQLEKSIYTSMEEAVRLSLSLSLSLSMSERARC